MMAMQNLHVLNSIRSALLMLSLIFCTSVFATPRFPAPPDAKVTLIGDEMVVNGIPMDIRIIDSQKSVDHILDYYRRFWPQGNPKEPGYTETDAMEPWKILTRAEGKYLMTVQMRPEGKGSTGYLAMSRLPESENKIDLGKGFPKVGGSQVFNDITSNDPNKKGRTIKLVNKQSVSRNVSFYRDHYERQGWVNEMDQGVDQFGHALRFRNGRESIDLVINQSNKGTFVTAQVVKESLF